ncbi:MAG: hypothetical protein K9N06_06405 [Candidatus Cloacimonetes bacterium]|nr:hypothetical protein [Candidatus Cloacimonadota bacterium]
MKSRLRERILFVICFVILFIVMVQANQKNRIYYLFNNNTGKLYRYYHLMPGEKYSGSIVDADSLIVYSRLILDADIPAAYSYQFSTGNFEDIVTRKISPSSSSRGVSGSKVSAWNSYKYFPMPEDKKFNIINDSDRELLVKVTLPDQKTYRKKTEFIAYPPDRAADSIQLLNKDNDYTYYLADKDGISMQLEGPLLLKVISRLIVKDVEFLSYSWAAYLDEEEILTVDAAAPYSKTCLADSSSIVTRGKVNILKVPAGIHTIKIMDLEPDEIIYRFYLNKTAIGNK